MYSSTANTAWYQESWFAARALRLAAEHGIRGIIAFSDPSEFVQPRPDGRLVQVKRGHYGIAYQSLNMDYLGQSAASWKEYFPDGTECRVDGGDLTRRPPQIRT